MTTFPNPDITATQFDAVLTSVITKHDGERSTSGLLADYTNESVGRAGVTVFQPSSGSVKISACDPIVEVATTDYILVLTRARAKQLKAEINEVIDTFLSKL